jgi:hypothetical protein
VEGRLETNLCEGDLVIREANAKILARVQNQLDGFLIVLEVDVR